MTTPATVAPTLSISADKSVYNVGDTLTLTADYSDSSTAPVSLVITASATDSVSGLVVNADVTVTVNTQEQQPMTIGALDTFNDSYSIVSNAAGVAVLTTTIGTPPAAS